VSIHRLVATDWEGRFELRDVRSGRYRLQITAPRLMATHSEDLVLDADRQLTIDLGATRVSGTVVDGTTAVAVSGAMVALRRLEGDEAAFLTAMGTDDDGYFALPHVTEGRYRMTVSMDGYSPWERVIDVGVGSALEEQRIALEPTRGLALAPVLASGRRPSQITAAFLDAQGSIALFETRAVDGDGMARFASAPPGDWKLLVAAPGSALAEVAARVPGDPTPVTLPMGSRLTVRVRQLSTSEAVAFLSLTDAAGRSLRTLSPYGTVETSWRLVSGQAVVDGVPPGRWTVRAVAPDGRVWSGAVVTAAGGDQVLDLQ